MSEPKRIQLRRTKGWRKPEGAIVVARPSRWGNPFRVGDAGITAEDAMELFRIMVEHAHPPYEEMEGLEILRGHDLACWCPLDQLCHADVLLELANAAPQPEGSREP